MNKRIKTNREHGINIRRNSDLMYKILYIIKPAGYLCVIRKLIKILDAN